MDMADPIQIDGLEIIGYADALTATMVPSIVPPVFRSKQLPRSVYLPPYHMNDGFLFNASVVSQSELDDLGRSEEITLFPTQPINAQRDFDLWLDQDFQSHYEPRLAAAEALRKIAEDHIAKAGAALKRGALTEADRLSGIAVSANDRRWQPGGTQNPLRCRRHHR